MSCTTFVNRPAPTEAQLLPAFVDFHRPMLSPATSSTDAESGATARAARSYSGKLPLALAHVCSAPVSLTTPAQSSVAYTRERSEAELAMRRTRGRARPLAFQPHWRESPGPM